MSQQTRTANVQIVEPTIRAGPFHRSSRAGRKAPFPAFNCFILYLPHLCGEGQIRSVTSPGATTATRAPSKIYGRRCMKVPPLRQQRMPGGEAKARRRSVVLDRPIKTLGVHAVRVRLHPEVTITVNVNIARSQDEAERQARGENVITSQFEEDRAADAEAMADMLEGGAGTHAPDREDG